MLTSPQKKLPGKIPAAREKREIPLSGGCDIQCQKVHQIFLKGFIKNIVGAVMLGHN
jgi:hypothetical protein